jgi:PAS domain S-box-containing protein
MIETFYSIFEKNMSRPKALFFVENRAFEGYWIWDLSEKAVYVNQQFLKKLGYDSFEGQENFTIQKLLALNKDKSLLNEILEARTSTLIFTYIKQNTETVKYEVEFLAIKDYLNRVTSYIFANVRIFEDESNTKNKKKLVNESFIQKEIFAELEEISNIGGWEINLITSELIWTKQLYKIHEVPENYIPKASNALNFYFAEDREKIIRALQNTILKSESFNLNCSILTAKNNIKWVRSSGRIFLENGRPVKIIGVFQDITQQIVQSEKLRISESTFRGNFEHSAIGIAILDEDGFWLEVNRRLCEVLGYSTSEIKKISFKDITHLDDLNTDLQFFRELVIGDRDNYQISKRYFHKNGSIIYGTISVSAIRNTDGSPNQYIAQFVDITENVIAKSKLEEAIKKMEAIFNASTQVSIVATDRNGVIKNFNSGAENLLGYTASEMIDVRTADFLHANIDLQIRKEELLLSSNGGEIFIYAELVKNGFDTREWIYTHKEGYEFPVLLTVTQISENEVTVGYLAVAIDLTELKKVEKEIKSLFEITKDQNERLKNFAHIVSHNLKSHASNFKMLLHLMVHDHPEFEGNEFINYLETASDDLGETITHLNEVAQLNTALIENLETINLHEVIETNIRNVLVLAVDQRVIIINNVSKDTTIQGISAYISSIVFNFLSNGIKYSNSKVDSYVKLSSNIVDDHLELVIEDNGIGIDLNKNGAKLFGMYKTFHNNADARGLGLFITKNQIEAMGGKIEVESKLNEGTTFKINLKI